MVSLLATSMSWREIGDIIVYVSAVLSALTVLYKVIIEPSLKRVAQEFREGVENIVEKKLAPIRAELTANGGTSLKDEVKRLLRYHEASEERRTVHHEPPQYNPEHNPEAETETE